MSKRPHHERHAASPQIEGKSFKVFADATTVKFTGRILSRVTDDLVLVEIDATDGPTQHLVPITSMGAGSLERGAGSWEFSDGD